MTTKLDCCTNRNISAQNAAFMLVLLFSVRSDIQLRNSKWEIQSFNNLAVFKQLKHLFDIMLNKSLTSLLRRPIGENQKFVVTELGTSVASVRTSIFFSGRGLIISSINENIC